MGTTLQHSAAFSRYDHGRKQSVDRADSSVRIQNKARLEEISRNITDLAKSCSGVFVSTILTYVLVVVTMGVLLVALPWLIIAPVALVGFVVIMCSYILALFA